MSSYAKHPVGATFIVDCISHAFNAFKKYPSSQTKHSYSDYSSLSRGVKSGYKVENVASPPKVGFPTLWHNLQFNLLEQSMQPFPKAKNVYV